MSKLYIASGITCFHDCFLGEGADGTIGCGNWMRAYQQLMKEGEPRLRVRLDLWYKMNPHLEKLGLLQGFGDDMLRIDGLKMFLDGAISGRTAALLEPYLHKPNYYGMLTMTKDELKEAVFAAHRAGLRVSVHANGDKAIKLYLDVVEDVLRKYPRDDHRHRAIHCSIVNPELIERIKRLGVLPTIFGCYAYYHGDKLLSAFGPERAEWMFAARSMLDAGIRVAAHSTLMLPLPAFDGDSLSSEQDNKGRSTIRFETMHLGYASYKAVHH